MIVEWATALGNTSTNGVGWAGALATNRNTGAIYWAGTCDGTFAVGDLPALSCGQVCASVDLCEASIGQMAVHSSPPE